MERHKSADYHHLVWLKEKIFRKIGGYGRPSRIYNMRRYDVLSAINAGPLYGSALKVWSDTCNSYDILLVRDKDTREFALWGTIFNRISDVEPITPYYKEARCVCKGAAALYYFHMVWKYLCNEGFLDKGHGHSIGAVIKVEHPPAGEVREQMKIAVLDRALSDEGDEYGRE